MIPIQPSEITPEHVYLSRRTFLTGMGALAASSLLAACGQAQAEPAAPGTASPVAPGGAPTPFLPALSGNRDELGAPLTPWEAVTQYTNFYEFATSKEGAARLARNFRTTPWTVDQKPLAWKTSIGSSKRSGSTVFAASKAGPWSFRGSAFRWPDY